MKTKIVFQLAVILCLTLASSAQVPEAFNYQAVIRNSAGEVINNSTVSFKLSILQNSENGSIVYAESQSVTTNNYGLANLKIGKGTRISGNFSPENWGSSSHFLKIEIDLNGGNNYELLGTTQLLAVPYAFHAKTVENDLVDDADADPENEIQTLNISGTQLTLSDGGGTVTLPSTGGGDNWGTQKVVSDNSLVGDGTATNPLGVDNAHIEPTWLNIGNKPAGFADGTDDVDDDDADVTNEIQTLSISGNDLSISDGNTVSLPEGSDTIWNQNSYGYIYSYDRVGIGTDMPRALLDVGGFCPPSGVSLYAERKESFGIAIYGRTTSTSGLTMAGYFLNHSSEGTGIKAIGGKYDFHAASESGKSYFVGKVGIGKGTPACKLHIKQAGTGYTSGLRLERPDNTNWWGIQINHNNDLVFDYNGTDTRAWIKDEDADFYHASDRRLKQNINTIKTVLDKVMQLNPVTFRFKSNPLAEKFSYGFIAQEVQELFPDMVSENNGTLGLAYQNFGVIGIKAIQEQQKLIVSQQKEIQRLANQNRQINKQLIELEILVEKLVQKQKADE